MTDRTVRQARAADWTIRVDELGSGPATYLLLHGYGVTPRYLRPTAVLLAPHGRVIMPTMPGWRGSDRLQPPLTVGRQAETLIEWLRAERTPPSLVVANSFGCQVAAELAAGAPDLVRGLVLTGPTVEPDARTFPRMIGRLLVNTVREPFPLARIIAMDYAAFGLRNGIRVGRLAMDNRLEDVLPLVGVPMLVVRGENDGLITRDWAQRCAGLAPHATFVEVAGASHAVPYNAPGDLLRLILDFERALPT